MRAQYHPYENGYSVGPGLIKLDSDRNAFGNGADRHAFQIDEDFPRYREGKMAAAERRQVFFTHRFPDAIERKVAEYIAARLCAEYPQSFSQSDGALSCALTGEELAIRDAGSLCALAGQVQEDLAVIRAEGEQEYLSAAHVCFPSDWDPETRIGKSFSAMHAPVAGMERVNARSAQLVRAIVEKGPYVRFAWGLADTDALSRHPDDIRRPIAFERDDQKLFVRVERQTTHPLLDVGAALFTTRLYVTDCAQLPPERREQIAAAVEMMSPPQLRYKGLLESRDRVLAYLRS